MPNDPFVDVAALTSLGPVQYLDARDRATFDTGHAPGAVHVPVEEWDKAAKAADIGFAKTAHWGEALGSLGVDPSAIAVAYDDGRMTNDQCRSGLVHPAVFWHQGRHPEWRLACTFLSDRTAGGCRALERRFPGGPQRRVRWFGRSGGPQAST